MQIPCKEKVTVQIIGFVKSIGIPVEFGEVSMEKEFLPGMCIQQGGLLIDMDKLKHPGDILHEAGHIAVATPAKRAIMDGRLGSDMDEDKGEEMMAIAWSYAAAKYLDIDPYIVFHADGYKGEGETIVKNFSAGHFFGVSMLQWIGLTYEMQNALENNTPSYPYMIKWLRE